MNLQDQNNLVTKGIDTFDNNLQIVVQQFLNDRKSQNLSKNTIRFYSILLGKFAEYCNAHSVNTIEQITASFIQDFLNHLREKGNNPGGVLAYFRSIKAMLKWHWWYNQITDKVNPIKFVRPPKNNDEPLDPVTEEQIELLISVCKKDTFGDVRDKTIILLLADTGLRAQELCDIEIENVFFGDNSIFIRRGKGNKMRMVFFTRKTRLQINRFLRIYSKNKKYLFSNQMGEKLMYTALRQIVRRRSEEAGVKGVELHDFRRYFALKSINAGMDLLTLSRILGHKNIMLLSRYAKQTTVDLSAKYKATFENV